MKKVYDGIPVNADTFYVKAEWPGETTTTDTLPSGSDWECGGWSGADILHATVSAGQGLFHVDSVPNLLTYTITSTSGKDVACRYRVTVKDSSVVILCAPLSTTSLVDTQYCFNSTAKALTTTPAGGDGSYTYQWQMSSDNGATWTDLSTVIGSHTPSTTVSGTFKYKVTVTSGSGCGSLEKTATVKVYDAFDVTEDKPNANYCKDATAAELSVSVTGSGDYSYQWYANGTAIAAPRGTSTTLTPETSNYGTDTTYSVNVTDNTCLTDKTVEVAKVHVWSELAFSGDPEVNNVACHSANTGSIMVTVTGGTPNYSYKINDETWTTGSTETSHTFNDRPAGNYTITVKDGCNTKATTATITITEPNELAMAKGDSTDIACHGQSTGTVQVHVTGGSTAAKPYKYQLDGTAESPFTSNADSTFTGLAAGTHTIKVTDNCGISKTVVFNLKQPDELSASNSTVNTDTSYCPNETADNISVTVTNGTAPYTYTWYGNGMVITDAVTATYTPTTTTSGSDSIFYVVVKDACGATATVNPVAHIKVYDAVTVSTTSSNTAYCKDETSVNTLNVSIAGGSGTAHYQWYKNGAAISGANTSTYAPETGTPGNFDYSVKVSNDCGGDSIHIAHITIHDAVTVSTTSSNTAYCKDETSVNTLNVSIAGGSGTAHYQWYKNGAAISGANTSTYAPETGTPGNFDYSVKVSNDCGGDSIHIANITIHDAVTVSTTSSNTAYCKDETSVNTLNVSIAGGSGTAHYQWYKNGAAISGANTSTYAPETGTPGNFDYSVKVSNDCGGDSIHIANITIHDAVTVSTTSSNTAYCKDETSVNTLNVSIAGGSGTTYYQWYKNGAAISGANTSTYAPETGTPGNFNYSVKVSNDCGGDSIHIAHITIHDAVTVSTTSSNTAYCKDETSVNTLNVSIAGGSGTTYYQWYKNGAAISGANTSTYAPETGTPGNFNYSVKVSNDCGGDSIHIAHITIHDAVTVSTTSSNTAYCKDETSVNTLNVSIAGGSGTAHYQWYKNGAAISGANTSTYAPETGTPGNFDYSVKVSNDCGGDSIHIAHITIHDAVTVSTTSSNTAYCKDETSVNTLNVSIAGGSGTAHYQWYKNGAAISGASTSTYAPETGTPGNFDYSVKVSNDCGGDSIHIAHITIHDAVTVSTTSSNTAYCKDETSVNTLNVSIAGGSGTAHYQWYKNGAAISGANTDTYTPETGTPGNFDYSVKVSNDCGGDSIHIAHITIHDAVTVSTTSSNTAYCKDETSVNALNVSIAGGSGTAHYQWYKNGAAISGANTDTYTPETGTPGNFDYSVKVSNDCGGDSIHIANITIHDAVTISTTSSDTAYCKDETSVNTLNVSIAGGSGTAHYQWYKNGAAISGANTSTYAPETGTPGNFDYSVKVSNDCGGDSIHIANITINPLPTITATPPSQTIPYGNSISTVVITNTNSIVLTPTLPTGFVYDPAGQTIDAASPAAGVYTITVSAESNTTPNCGTVTAEVKVEVKNDNTPIVISSGNNSWKYNGAARSEETYKVTYGSTTVTDVDASGKVFTLPSGDKVTISNPASITNVSETADHNNTYSYTLDHASYYTNVTATYGKLTILPRTVVMTSASDSKMYDGTPLTRNNQSDVTVTGDGFVTGEGATYNITGSQKSAGSSANAFTYTLNGGTLAENYTTSTVNGMLEVTKHPFTISLDSVKVYDGAPFMVTASQLHVTGFVNNDALASGEMWTESGEVGEYENQDGSFQTTLASGIIYKGGFSILDSSGSSVTSCYTPTFKVKLSISPCTITITAATDAKSYDGTPLTNSGYSITAGALVSSDNLASCIVTGSQLCLGSSPNVPSGAVIKNGTDDVTGNYTIHYVNGTLTVTQATGFSCPPAETFYLDDCAANMTVTLTGTPTVTGVAAGHYTVTNNLASLNPMGAGTHTVTWSLLDDCNNVVATCDQTVKVDYKPCVGVTWQGHFYDAVRVGSQCWLAENIRWATGNHAAYKEGSTNLDKFGYLYSWYTAVGVNEDDDSAIPTTKSGTCGEPYVQGICPDGWGVGSEADFSLLNATAGSTDALKEMSSLYWLSSYEGTLPNTGFNSRGGGWYNSSLARYEDLMTGAHFWCSDATPGSTTFSSVFTYYCDETLATHSRKTDKMSVRCIRKVMP